MAGMYALKRRQKRFHDSHIITKQFKLGDLVLVYTLKIFQSKFSKARQGPFFISSVSSSGAIKVVHCRWQGDANWISGCCVKKYYTPFTTQKMECL